MPTKINFEAFQALFLKFKALTETFDSPHPRTIEDWVETWLKWMQYPPSVIKSLDKINVTDTLLEIYPWIVKEDFDADEYYDALEADTARMNGYKAALEEKPRKFTLVKTSS